VCENRHVQFFGFANQLIACFNYAAIQFRERFSSWGGEHRVVAPLSPLIWAYVSDRTLVPFAVVEFDPPFVNSSWQT
jgi:hypothetical protein